MSEKNVKLGDGLADSLKNETNQELANMGKLLIDVVSEYVKGKIQNFDIDKMFSPKEKDKLISFWSSKLFEKGLVPKGYAGLPDKFLIDNLHQDGYLDGLYAGYALAMMSLTDHGASKELILSVRDDLSPNLIGHHYNDRESFYSRYEDPKYHWIERAK